MRRKRILLVFTDLMRGGAQMQQLRVIKALADKPVSFFVCCIKEEGALADSFREAGVPVYALGMRSKWEFSKAVQLLKLARQLNIDVVYTKGGGDSLFWGRLMGWLSGVPRVFSSFHTTGKTVAGSDPYKRINVLFNTLTDLFIFECNVQRRQYLQKYRIPRQKSIVIHSGIKPEGIVAQKNTQIRRELGLSPETLVVAIVAGFRPFKNHRMFLEVARRIHSELPETVFLLLGEGKTRPDAEVLAEKLGIKKACRFLGHRSDVIQYVAVADVVALTSTTSETFPNCLLEAMSQKIPIVSTRVGGVEEMIWDGQNGFLIEQQDVTKMVEKTLSVLKNRKMAREMGNRAFEICSKHFAIEDRARDLLNHIHDNPTTSEAQLAFQRS